MTLSQNVLVPVSSANGCSVFVFRHYWLQLVLLLVSLVPLLINQVTSDACCNARIIDGVANLSLPPALPPGLLAALLRPPPVIVCECFVGQIGISLMSPERKQP